MPPETQTFVRQTDEIVPCMNIFRRWCSPCPISPMFHSCVSNLLSTSGVVFAACFWSFRSSTRDSSRHYGTSLLSSWSILLARLPNHTSCLCCCYIYILHARLQLYFERGFCRVPLRLTQPASIDRLSWCMCRLRSLLSQSTRVFGACTSLSMMSI